MTADSSVPTPPQSQVGDCPLSEAPGRVLTPENTVIEAAVAWVERISSRPGQWADDKDHALIDAVKALTGATYPWEKS